MFPLRVSSILILFLLGISHFTFLSGRAQAKDRAEQVYMICAQCHGSQGEGDPKIAAPSIAGLPEWYLKAQLVKFRDGARGKHPGDIAGMRMRPMARTIPTASDVDAVSAYVAALKRPNLEKTITGNAAKGMETYAVCSACHGPKAQGIEELNAPPLVGYSDWYLYTQLKNFKAGVRGANPATDLTGSQMQAISLTLDEESMLNVISYINKLE